MIDGIVLCEQYALVEFSLLGKYMPRDKAGDALLFLIQNGYNGVE